MGDVASTPIGFSVSAFLRRGNKLWLRPHALPGWVTVEAHAEGGALNMTLCPEHAIGLRDELLTLYPLTPSGRKARVDRKTDREKAKIAGRAPGALKVLHALRDYGAGDWQTVRAIANCTGQTEAVVRTNLHILKQTGKVAVRQSDLPSAGPQPITEWRIK